MNLPISITSMSEAGVLTGVAAFDDGQMDRNRRRYVAGAFDKSLAEHKRAGTMPAMLLFHDMHRPVGAWETITPKGNALEVRGTIARDTEMGAEAYAMVRSRSIQSLSTGAIHRKIERANEDRRPGESGGEVITDAELLEVSLVAVPGNRNTRIIRVSEFDGPSAIEEVFRAAGWSGRRAKTAASAAWRSIQTNEQQGTERLAAILSTASEKLARFNEVSQ
jgi:HK97 family phage prohead protease